MIKHNPAGEQRRRALGLTLLLVIAAVFIPGNLSANFNANANATEINVTLDMEAEWHRQFLALEQDLARSAHFAQVEGEVFRREALILDSDRDPADIVLRRTAALLEDLQQMPESPAGKLEPLAAAWETLEAARHRIEVTDAEARYALYTDACQLRREIAFCNPLLDFDDIVFIKRHRAIYEHMVDQFAGIAAMPGGGLYVLEDAFGSTPKLRDILADSVVERGRLAGERLEGGPNTPPEVQYDGMGTRHGEDTGGSFLSPHLSYDAQQILFAYVENQGDQTVRHHTNHSENGYWDKGRCYHIFRVNIDGSGLEQLTDGTWNDFDPVLMPSGRIVFNSERRGGYLRCGRVCPVYTLFDMAPDGSDIRRISFHESNEWHPSVAHDGMIMFTRWDYVDRHGVVSHHPWTITPDGRDPRAIHGNYSRRPHRADMQLNIQAIPNSRLYVATAAPHHGQAFGSLVVFDPRVPDNDMMAPVSRLTPEVPFPESQGPIMAQSYGQAAPLSEDYHLAAYDAAMDVQAIEGPRGRYGLYLLDSFGNRELLYRDPEIGSQYPMPLRSRPTPPIIPEGYERVAEGEEPEDAIVGVADVYDSLLPWPEGTKIEALRIYQIFPLSVASALTPHNTGIQIPQGNDSINLARAVLGTVPVEEDGSAYFKAPADRTVYFQALDSDGLAVTSMRSATQFQPGERAMCLGCHEPRHNAPPPEKFLQAMRREPSELQPDVDGSNPFSYPRLVQPVLDRNCVDCHQENADTAPPLDSSLAVFPGGNWMNQDTTYYQSYISLAPEFGFYDYGGTDPNDPKWYRTTPGEFGARASKLYQLLKAGHYDVELSDEDMHRITLWLDSVSLFYGVYEEEGGKAQLRGEIAHPTLE